MTPSSPSCIVIGAGPIGLCTARVLARAGCSVTLIDDDKRGAGWASGGMLGAVYETLDNDDFSPAAKTFALDSQWLWRQYLDAMGAPSVAATVFIARTPAEHERLFRLGDCIGDRNISLKPCVVPEGIVGLAAWLCASDIAINPRALLAILRDDCAAAGVRRHAGIAIGIDGQRVALGDGHALTADFIILASGMGASTSMTASVPELACLEPVKGQMMAVACGNIVPDHVTRAGRVYVIPRGQSLVIGATSQFGVGDVEPLDRISHQELWHEGCALMPSLAAGQIIESWAGLRPKTPDGLPIVGRSQNPRVILATGAYRNGWLLAAGIANAVMGLVLSGEQPARNLQPFAPNRFSIGH